jgi:hypothetical protein
MKTVACPECDRVLRPCNLARHRKAQHYPRGVPTEYGHRFLPPALPIRVGREQDRRYDEHVPRGNGDHRYRIYRLRAGELELVASAPEPEHMGLGLVTLHAEGEFGFDDSVGVLDTLEDPGHWVVHPWALGRRAP